jgi:hypothetical protein
MQFTANDLHVGKWPNMMNQGAQFTDASQSVAEVPEEHTAYSDTYCLLHPSAPHEDEQV